MLTKGLDNYQGTAGNDTIIGSVDDNNAELNTMSTLDVVNGGAGVDTLKVAFNATKAAAIALPNLSNVEIIEVQATQNFTLNTSTTAGVTDLNVTKATGTAGLTGSDAQNISVAGATNTVTIDGGKNITVNDATADTDITIGGTTVNAGTITVTDTKLGTGTITIDGGTDVTVTASGVTGTGTIDIGQGGAATDLPSGAVVVNSTGAAYVAAGSPTLSDITVTGGTTISVTQVATSDASKAAADKAAGTITQGNITITAAATTTDVTVKQTAAQAVNNAADSTGGVTETVSVKFVALKANDVIELNGLTFTADVDMEAADVAKAFANLAANAAIPDDADAAAIGDADGATQGSAKYSAGTYTGSLDGWSTGAANGDTVVFTYSTVNAAPGAAALASGAGTSITTGALTLTTLTTGKAHDATPVGGVAAIVAGVVDITADAAVTTVSVDGFSAAGSKIQDATTNAALATITLANGGDMTIDSAATTLALNLTNVSGTVDVVANTTTLNATVTGTTTATLDSASATSVNISGTGRVAGTTAAGGLTAATAINTTGMTAGAAAFALTSTATSYTGGAGADEVTLINTTATTKAIDLGAGEDTLVLAAGGATTSTVTIKGGDGDDTLSLTTALAANDSLSANTAFGAKLDSFERLLINNAGATKTVDLANLGFTNYVTTTGSTDTLTLDKLATNGTVIVTANNTAGLTVNVKDADKSTTDALNLTLSKDGILAAGTVTVAEVETVNLTVTDTNTANGIATHTMTFTADKATKLDIGGNAGLTLTLGGATTKLATIDGSDMEGALSVAANGGVAMTITGGSGADNLAASVGATSKADIINGGAGNDTIVVGGNGAQLTGGAGNDLFILTDAAGNGGGAGFGGTNASNTYSTILDFGTGADLLQLRYNDDTGGTGDELVITSFAKLEANVQDAVNPQSYIEAVMNQLETAGGAGNAVWFMHGSDTYIVVDSGADALGGVFNAGEDLIVKLTGVNGANLSFNSDFGTVALV